MTRPLRDKDPSSYRLITIRTAESRVWITPSRKVRKLIGGIFARYQELCGVELFAYDVLGNHMHILCRAPCSNVDEFLENVNREISRRLNRKHGREGKFWGRRYDDLKVLSEADLLEAFLYVNTNATKHGLVEDSRLWPGLHSFEHVLKEKDRIFTFTRTSVTREDAKRTTHRLKISPLPQFRSLKKKQRFKILARLLEGRMSKLRAERKVRGGGFLGLSKIAEQSPGHRPENTSRSPRPPCYTKDADLRAAFIQARKLLATAYRDASFRYRLGMDAIFPNFTFKPPTHRKPRLLPFQTLVLYP